MTTCPSCGHKFTHAQTDTSDFETWWKAYPRKVGKGQARKAYHAALAKTDTATLLQAAHAFKKLMAQRMTDVKLQPHPATFLNGERWLDDELTKLMSVSSEPSVTTSQTSQTSQASWPVELSTKIGALIGPDKFRTWFGESSFTPSPELGQPVIIRVKTSLRRDWIEKHFPTALFSVLGVFEIEVEK